MRAPIMSKYPIISWEENGDTITIHWSDHRNDTLPIPEAEQLWGMLSAIFTPPVITRSMTPEQIDQARIEIRSKHNGYPLTVFDDESMLVTYNGEVCGAYAVQNSGGPLQDPPD
jgi:hypothetical protein